MCRGPPGDLSATIPTLPALAPGGDTLTLRMLLAAPGGRGAEGTRRCEHHGRPRSGRAGLAGLRSDSGVVAKTAFQTAHTPLFWLSALASAWSSLPIPAGAGARCPEAPEPSGRKFQLSAGRVRELSVRGSDGRGAGAAMRHLQGTLVFPSHAKGTLLSVPTLEVPRFGSSLGPGTKS